jgi:hypothetical protein
VETSNVGAAVNLGNTGPLSFPTTNAVAVATNAATIKRKTERMCLLITSSLQATLNLGRNTQRKRVAADVSAAALAGVVFVQTTPICRLRPLPDT